jgi:hypothetical protein
LTHCCPSQKSFPGQRLPCTIYIRVLNLHQPLI